MRMTPGTMKTEVQPVPPFPVAHSQYVQASTAGQRFLGTFSSLWATSELLGSAWYAHSASHSFSSRFLFLRWSSM